MGFPILSKRSEDRPTVGDHLGSEPPYMVRHTGQGLTSISLALLDLSHTLVPTYSPLAQLKEKFVYVFGENLLKPRSRKMDSLHDFIAFPVEALRASLVHHPKCVYQRPQKKPSLRLEATSDITSI